MKRLVFALITMAALAFSGSVYAGSIVGTKHDLTNGQPGEVCVYCHTPHNANTAITAPLWNRASSTATYTMYSSATIDMTQATNPQGVSLACLTCHDGTIAVDQYLNGPTPPAGGESGTLSGDHKIGPDLSNDHPISITYDNTKDTEFNALSAISATLPFFGTGSDQLECATCHDVHDGTNGDFLRLANTGSALCTTCHVK